MKPDIRYYDFLMDLLDRAVRECPIKRSIMEMLVLEGEVLVPRAAGEDVMTHGRPYIPTLTSRGEEVDLMRVNLGFDPGVTYWQGQMTEYYNRLLVERDEAARRLRLVELKIEEIKPLLP